MEEGANVMIMIGCDFHPGMQELCVLDAETGRRREQWLSHDLGPAPVREFYAGLSKPVRVGLEAEYSSGGRQRLGHISKEGNVFLRWVLVEAANVAVRYDHELKRVYWRLVERRGKSIAKGGMARKLLPRLYWMLRRRSESRRLGQRSRVAGKLEA